MTSDRRHWRGDPHAPEVVHHDDTPLNPPAAPRDPGDFTVMLGGPLYRAFVRAHLSGANLELLHRRVVFLLLVTWLVPAVLAAVNGDLLGGTTAVPFLFDASAQARLLLVVPLLAGTELVVHQRIRAVVGEFVHRHVVPPEATGRFQAVIATAGRFRDSIVAELLLVAAVYALALTSYRPFAEGLGVTTWFVKPAAAGMAWTPAGQWYSLVSMPVFHFLLARWYYRILIWAGFLWAVARLPLRLVPTHPDRLGGLGFVVAASGAFVPLAMAHGALMSGLIANRIFHIGARLPEFTIEIAAVTLLVWIIVFGPLTVFALPLVRAKRAGMLEYGRFAGEYVREFDRKWLRGGAPAGEPVLGSSDVQSLADMGNSYAVVGAMRPLPVSRDALVRVTAATLLPLAPLLLTIMPLEEFLRRLVGMFL